MGGGLMTLVYGIAKREPVMILGQAFAGHDHLYQEHHADRSLAIAERRQKTRWIS